MTNMTREYIGGYGFDGEPELTGEEIVRCRDCKYFDMTRKSDLNNHAFWCKHRCSFELDDGYCYMGEREEGGE